MKSRMTVGPARRLFAVALSALCLLGVLAIAAAASKPNFVVIFIDDMGYGDIGPFGSTINDTPHLDRMAREGMKLTSFYVTSGVCTPSRSSLMTGCYPLRVGLPRGSGHAVLFPGDHHGLHPEEITIAEVLKEAGYATGCFGKWHLGDQPQFLPTRQGFDYYFGIPYSNDMWPGLKRWQFPDLPLMRNEKVVGLVKDMRAQGQLCRQFTEEAVKFIRGKKDQPFFVYLPHAFVHHPRGASDSFLTKAGLDESFSEDPQATTHNHKLRERTKAQIEEVDWSVGRILDMLRELKLEKDTFVIFTSDNGGASGCVNKPLKGGKGSQFEGGMREPTIAWRPGTIPAGSVCDEVASTMDLLPTFAKLAGTAAPTDRIIDGRDIANLLLGRPDAKSPHKAFYYYGASTLRAVRSGPWKLFANGTLYNLDDDIGETRNVAARNPKVVKRLNVLLEEARNELGDGQRVGPHVRSVGIAENPRTLVPRPGVEGEAGYIPTLKLKRKAR